ncbi:MAG: 2-amino-4-hydroxy-6-hydroxymethyldihydropteridine diphosphokinase [Luteimonas sp.]
MSARWLLVLGSDAADGAPIEATLAALEAVGRVQALTPARRTRDDDGAARWFTNRLVCLDSDLARDVLRGRLQAIERDIGRSEQSDAVPIDIDLLACDPDGTGWRLDPHAAGKREHRRPHVAALLREAGVALP